MLVKEDTRVCHGNTVDLCFTTKVGLVYRYMKIITLMIVVLDLMAGLLNTADLTQTLRVF